jgi:hypothetical protein
MSLARLFSCELRMNRISPRSILPCCLLLALALVFGRALAADPLPPNTFARIGDTVIPAPEFEAAYTATLREKFYHFKPPEGEEAKVRREVGESLIGKVLTYNEAKRREVKPDREKVDAQVAGYDQRYGSTPHWKENRERVLPALIGQLERESMIERLEASVREVPEPTPEEVKRFYETKPELFTEPEKLRLAVILLKVDPSSPQSAWDAAHEEAKAIVARLKKGADFAELAKLHSGDKSGAQGGDMGYLHKGMIPEATAAVLEKLPLNVASEPVQLLEGVAIFEVKDKTLPKQRAFDEVKTRAAALLKRDLGDKAWSDLQQQLRSRAQVQIDTQRFPEFLELATKP